MSNDEIIAFSIFALVAVIPLFAASVVAHRFRRGRLWVAAPWLLLAALTALGGQLLYSMGSFGPGSDVTVNWLMTLLISAWLAATIFLIALVIAGPNLPPLGTIGRK